jgi:hypothetical protein
MVRGSCNKDGECDSPAARGLLAGIPSQQDTQPLTDTRPLAARLYRRNTAPEPPPTDGCTAPVPPAPGPLTVPQPLYHSSLRQRKPQNNQVPEPALPVKTKSWTKQIAWKFPETSAMDT